MCMCGSRSTFLFGIYLHIYCVCTRKCMYVHIHMVRYCIVYPRWRNGAGDRVQHVATPPSPRSPPSLPGFVVVVPRCCRCCSACVLLGCVAGVACLCCVPVVVAPCVRLCACAVFVAWFVPGRRPCVLLAAVCVCVVRLLVAWPAGLGRGRLCLCACGCLLACLLPRRFAGGSVLSGAGLRRRGPFGHLAVLSGTLFLLCAGPRARCARGRSLAPGPMSWVGRRPQVPCVRLCSGIWSLSRSWVRAGRRG